MVNKNHGPGCRDASQGGHEVGEAVLLLQLVETNVLVGGLSGGEGCPVDSGWGLLEATEGEGEGVDLGP